MTNLKTIIMCLLTIISVNVFSQNQWYFGEGAGLDFTNASNTNPPIPTSSPISTGEGSAMAYDQNGNLLFYTDGRIIYNSQHGEVTAGNGPKGPIRVRLNGAPSSTQTAVIVPIPGNNCRDFVIFTVGSYEEYNSFINQTERFYNLNYTIVNVRPNSSNNYEVVVDRNNINRELNFRSFDPNMRLFSEKLTAIKNPNNDNFWVMTHDFNDNGTRGLSFYAIEVNNDFIANPNNRIIRSTIGDINTDGISTHSQSAGQMKFSNDGRRVALTNGKKVQLLDFNSLSGNLSNLRNIDLFPSVAGGYYYGLEFSTDNNSLFVTMVESSVGIYRINNLNNVVHNQIPNFTRIIQSYNTPGVPMITSLRLPDGTAPVSGSYIFAALQLNPKDGNLYCARGDASLLPATRRSFIGRITNLNTNNPVYNILTLSTGKYSVSGLPTTITGLIGCGFNPNECKLNEPLKADFYLEQSKTNGETIIINTVPKVTKGVEHYWGIVGNGKTPNCNCSCEDIPLQDIKNAKTTGVWATHIKSDGTFENIGIGTNVTAGTSGYGIKYGGFPYYGCYKITHYVVCGDKIKSFTTCVNQSPTNN